MSVPVRWASALSRLDCVQRLQHQLDDAVRLQRADADQLRNGGEDDPEGRMRQKFHGQPCGCASSLLTRCSTVFSR